jgi:PDZ domain-containing secreted protein
MTKPHWRTLVLCITAVLVMYLGFVWFVSSPGFSAISATDLASRGQFGDQFGALNTLFAGLGAALLLFTLFFQFSQLRDQQKDIERQLKIAEAQAEELKAQRTEMARTAEAQERQLALTIAQMKITYLQTSIEVNRARGEEAGIAGSNVRGRSIAKSGEMVDKMEKIIADVETRLGMSPESSEQASN